jgi:hypothetical protein
MSHDPARWNNRTEAEAEAGLRRHAAILDGALQTRAIRENVRARRAEIRARQRAARPAPARSFRQRLRDAADAFRA